MSAVSGRMEERKGVLREIKGPDTFSLRTVGSQGTSIGKKTPYPSPVDVLRKPKPRKHREMRNPRLRLKTRKAAVGHPANIVSFAF